MSISISPSAIVGTIGWADSLDTYIEAGRSGDLTARVVTELGIQDKLFLGLRANPPGPPPYIDPPPADERPLWQTVALLYSAIAFLAVFLIAACYVAAYLATGSAY